MQVPVCKQFDTQQANDLRVAHPSPLPVNLGGENLANFRDLIRPRSLAATVSASSGVASTISAMVSAASQGPEPATRHGRETPQGAVVSTRRRGWTARRGTAHVLGGFVARARRSSGKMSR
jgi:hypothetical protein